MKVLRTDKNDGSKEIIDQYELLFRLSDRLNRPKDISDIMAGKIIDTNYSTYQII